MENNLHALRYQYSARTHKLLYRKLYFAITVQDSTPDNDILSHSLEVHAAESANKLSFE